MMKKKYIIPAIELIKNEPETFLAGSGEVIEGGEGNIPTEADSKTGSIGWEDDDESKSTGW